MEEALNLPAKPCVYILLCANGQYYVGSTTNLELRMKEHFEKPESMFYASRFTKGSQPIELVYTETFETIHEARVRERQLHKWSHSKKQALINGDIELLKQLSKSKDYLSLVNRKDLS